MMEIGDIIMNKLKTEKLRENIFPIHYYILKGIYDKNFYKKSKYFVDSLFLLYDSFATNLDLSIFDESVIMKNYTDKNIDITNISNNSFFNNFNNDNVNKIKNIDNQKFFNLNNNNKSTFNVDTELKNDNFKNNDNPNLSMMNDSIIFDFNHLKPSNFKNFNNMSKMNNLNNTFFADKEIIDDFYNKNKKRETNAFGPNDTLNITINKYNYNNLSKQMTRDRNFYLNFILHYYDEHILDREENYPILHLIKNYIFSDEDPNTSTLLITYNLFASSIELIFCLKQAEKLPNTICTPAEKKFILQQNKKIKSRIRNFLNAWLNIPDNQKKVEKKKNEILRILLKQELEELVPMNNLIINENNFYLSNTIFDNPLIENYISITRIIKDQTLFYFNTIELARQICLIDHEIFCKIKYQEFSDFIVKGIISENFEIFRLRDLQLKCYILSLYYKQDYLDKKKEIIKNFIILAKILKGMKNFQTSFTIISVLIKLEIANKKDIWRSLEKYERDLFRSLKTEYNNMENNVGIYQIINFVYPNFNINNNTLNYNTKESYGNTNNTNYTSQNPNNNLNNSEGNNNLKNQNNFLDNDNTTNIYLNNNNINLNSKNTYDISPAVCNIKDMNSSISHSNINEITPSVPNINLIRSINSYFSNKLKLANKLQENLILAKEFKYFIQDLINKKNFKYSFHKVNPIYDFFSFGFIEILRLVKFKKIINYNPENPDFEKIYDDLIKKINEKRK